MHIYSYIHICVNVYYLYLCMFIYILYTFYCFVSMFSAASMMNAHRQNFSSSVIRSDENANPFLRSFSPHYFHPLSLMNECIIVYGLKSFVVVYIVQIHVYVYINNIYI